MKKEDFKKAEKINESIKLAKDLQKTISMLSNSMPIIEISGYKHGYSGDKITYGYNNNELCIEIFKKEYERFGKNILELEKQFDEI